MTTPPPRTGRESRLRRFTAARMDPQAYLGLHATVGFVVVAIALWLFGALLEEILDNARLVRWDAAADAWVHARTTPVGLRVFDAVTQVGSPAAMALLALVGAVLLWRGGRRTTLAVWLAAFGGGALLDQVLKRVVHRARPTFGTAYLHGQSFSFPSGHAMGSMIGFGMLAYVLAHRERPGALSRAALYALAVALVALVGASRIYLGVHYPSDVVGGWAAGGAWLAICLTGAGIARRRPRRGSAGLTRG